MTLEYGVVSPVRTTKETLGSILDEVVVDGATIAHEALGHEPESWVRERIEEVHTVLHNAR
jgi:D-ribose pyranase